MNPQFGQTPTLIWPESGVAAQAAYWFTLIDSEACTEANRRAFALWRCECPRHEEAYLTLIEQCIAIELLSDDPEILALRRQALEPHQRRHSFFRNFAAVAACFIAVTAFWTINLQTSGKIEDSMESPSRQTANIDEHTTQADHHIVTAVGEQITKILIDGSKIVLNTDSEVRIQFTKNKRSLYLLRGQAFFDVAHDKNRPFIVYANGQRVTALGTQFEIRINQKDVQVILLEGKVKIDELTIPDASVEKNVAPRAPIKSVELLPGQAFSSLEEEPKTVNQAVIDNVMNWKRGLINYSGEPLEDVITELNRYSVRKIELADPAIGLLGVSGTLKTGSIDQQALKLAAIYDLDVETDPNTSRVIINWKQK